MTSDFPPPIVLLVCLVFCLVGSTCLYHIAGRFAFDYRLRPDRIEFVALRFFSIAHITFRDIAQIRKASWLDAMSPGVLSLHNRFFCQWLMITRRRGLIRRIMITPGNADEFIEAVRNERSTVESTACGL